MKRFGRLQFRWNVTAKCFLEMSLVVTLAGVGASPLHAQAAVEAAGANASSSSAAASSKAVATVPPKTAEGASAHLPASSGPPADEANRRSFEDHAGTTPGKLMLRSLPTDAKIFINGLYVGRAPLLLLLAPGKYKLEMRGSRQEFGRRTIIVTPNETKDTVFNLALMYPGRVAAR